MRNLDMSAFCHTMIPTTQLPGESNRAYESFKLYLNMGPKRSQKRVAKKLSVSRQYIGRLSRLYKWRERVSAAFLEDHDAERRAKDQAALEVARELELRRECVRKDAWRLYSQFIEATEQHLRLPLSKSKPSDAAALAKMADILWRIAVGEQVSPSELTGHPGYGNPVPRPGAVPIINVIHRSDARTEAAKKIMYESIREMKDPPPHMVEGLKKYDQEQEMLARYGRRDGDAHIEQDERR